MVFLQPRSQQASKVRLAPGTGPAKFIGDDFKQTQIRKRYYLLGQSLETMQTWDIRQAMGAILAAKRPSANGALEVNAGGATAGMALYASLFTGTRLSLQLSDLPASHMQGPYYPKILRYMDMPAAVLLAGERHEVILHTDDPARQALWEEVIALADQQPGLSVRKK